MIQTTLRITESRALSYRIPETRSSQPKFVNYAVALTAEASDGTISEGSGEGQPRGWMTGDNAGNSWGFLSEVIRRLESVELDISSTARAVTSVQTQMAEFFTLAEQRSPDSVNRHPFRGSLLAVETALLDLTARALSVPLTALITEGAGADTAGDSDLPQEIAGPAAGAESSDEFQRAARRPFDWEQDTVPVAQHDDLLQALLILETAVRRADHSQGVLGLDLGGLLDMRAGKAFVRRVVALAVQGDLPKRVILERVLPRHHRGRTQLLQDEADAALRASGRRDITVELHHQWRYWDHQTPSRQLQVSGRPSVQVIRPTQYGSLLRTAEAVERISSEHPEAVLLLADFPGATSLSRAALRSLARACPGARAHITDAADGGEYPVGAPHGADSGHGVALAYEAIVGDVREMTTYPAPPQPTYEGRPVAVYHDVDHLHPLGPNGSKGHLLERQALALGLSTTRYSKGAFRAGDGSRAPLIFKWSRNPLSSAASLALSTHKEGTRMQLQRAGVPVPQGRTFANGDFATAKQFVDRIGYPVVVKPAMGVRGIGVVAGIQNEQELEAAFDIMASSKLGKQDFIVEKHINGRDYRIVVVGDEVIAAIQREPASVFGDGESTIAELLLNKNIARKRNPHLWARPAKYDAAARHELKKAGMTLSSVPAQGERVLLANTCSLSQGGDSIDVLDELHPSIIEACIRTVNAIPQLEYCGVDFLLEDHTKPLDQQDAGICELNAHAAIGNCEYPMFGSGKPVAETVMRACIDHYGLTARSEPAEEVALHLTIRGKVTGVGFRKWLQRRARSSGLTGWVRNVDRKTVEAVLVGETVAATAVAAATILGPRAAVPTSYVAQHVEKPDVRDFVIREDTAVRVKNLAKKVTVQAGREARRLKIYRPKNAQEAGAA
ncbi:acylphosphatase [Nesterenkonia alkaliphila]|uniref:acylphosphatase n=1 Tax=Nesterenkonia alkaliphila TaxID=1463631 RepID=A0A7K1ULT1_9MICC|nr:acylphosphatase [Nesterenkonia alkaliphila]MVT27001.1 ATP-grasp domain-containing protein [Nesterenkonia alkaliphila]GFZ96703.1 hypothetical protein GCM10011359_27690 [Nesterenkonia alkaliphila]